MAQGLGFHGFPDFPFSDCVAHTDEAADVVVELGHADANLCAEAGINILPGHALIEQVCNLICVGNEGRGSGLHRTGPTLAGGFLISVFCHSLSFPWCSTPERGPGVIKH